MDTVWRDIGTNCPVESGRRRRRPYGHCPHGHASATPPPYRDLHPGAAMTGAICIVCGSSGQELCSWACLEAARLERNRNLTRLRHLGEDASASALRFELTRRNGAIINALMSWRPHVDEFTGISPASRATPPGPSEGA